MNSFRQAPTGDWLFFSVAKWENVGDQLWNSGHQFKIFSRIGDQESVISDPGQLNDYSQVISCIYQINYPQAVNCTL